MKAVKPVITFDKYAVIKHPLSSESAIKTIEDCNTLVFIVHKKADKKMIKKACADLYSIKIKKVNGIQSPILFINKTTGNRKREAASKSKK